MNEQELLDLKQEIEQAKARASELKGELKSRMQQLEKDWGCKTVEQADKKVKTLEKEIEDLNEKINKGIEELQEKYEI